MNPDTPSLPTHSGKYLNTLLQDSSVLNDTRSNLHTTLSSADASLAALRNQNNSMSNTGNSFGSMTENLLPRAQNLISKIDFKRNKDTFILASVIAACILFLIYWYWG